MFIPTYTKVAFESICEWLYEEEDETDHEDKMNRLVSFKRDDINVFALEAEGLWRTTTARNQPWGRSYTNPTYYLHLDCREKVRNGHVISRIGFFFCVWIFFLVFDF